MSSGIHPITQLNLLCFVTFGIPIRSSFVRNAAIDSVFYESCIPIWHRMFIVQVEQLQNKPPLLFIKRFANTFRQKLPIVIKKEWFKSVPIFKRNVFSSLIVFFHFEWASVSLWKACVSKVTRNMRLNLFSKIWQSRNWQKYVSKILFFTRAEWVEDFLVFTKFYNTEFLPASAVSPSTAVWPDFGLKRSPNFPKICSESSNSRFSWKWCFKKAQNIRQRTFKNRLPAKYSADSPSLSVTRIVFQIWPFTAKFATKA